MTSGLLEQIKQVQQQLRKQAQRLGQLNLKNNDVNIKIIKYLEQNEKLAQQIVELRNKIIKKKHMIQQENKDKMLIHEKLIKAERQKQLLQIQNHHKEQNKLKQLQILKEAEQVSRQFKAVDIQQDKINIKQLNKQQAQKAQQNQLPKQQQKPSQPVKTVPASKSQQPSNHIESLNQHYADTSTGEYQPPILFEQTEHTSDKQKSDDQDDQIDQDTLAKLKQLAQDQQDDQQDQINHQ